MFKIGFCYGLLTWPLLVCAVFLLGAMGVI